MALRPARQLIPGVRERGVAMNHDLALRLELLAEAADLLLFRLAVCNRSAVKLLLPYPEIHGLRFTNKATLRESDWGTCEFVSASWAGFTLSPGEEKAIEYRVRPSSVNLPAEDDDTDYYPWCVDLPDGEYAVWFQIEVGEDYFCPDSHYEYPDLQREAEGEQAVVWTGHVRSNRLNLIRETARIERT